MTWRGRLDLHYRRDGARTVAHDRHDGPLRVLQRLYPEGEGICHHVLVHPPGGLAGGDELEVDVRMDADAHAVITTPGATRYYRTESTPAVQQVRLHLEPGARLEWLPLETLAYDGCEGVNRVELHLDSGAAMIGWDLLALGLPAADLPFRRGGFTQHLHWPGHWLERGRIDAHDRLLLDSPLGWDGRRVLATMWWAGALDAALRETLLESARAVLDAAPADLACHGGVTAPHGSVVVVRLLAARVEPAMAVLADVRKAWREAAWGLPSPALRIWAT